jgi:hypothetical protein
MTSLLNDFLNKRLLLKKIILIFHYAVAATVNYAGITWQPGALIWHCGPVLHALQLLSDISWVLSMSLTAF